MLKTLYLHIGAPKTGTTSLQDFFYRNENLLNRHNATYFNELAHSGNHWSLMQEISNQRGLAVNDSKTLTSMEETCHYLMDSRFEYGLLSSESLAFYLNNQFKRPYIEKMFDELNRNGVTIYIIGVVREPVSYRISAYGEDVTGCGCPFSFAGWLETLQGKGHRNVIMSMQKWSHLAGDNHMLWFPYSGSHEFFPELIRSILHSFCQSSAVLPEFRIPVKRQSFSASQIEAVRRLNATKYEKWYMPVIDKPLFDMINNTFGHNTSQESKTERLNLSESELNQTYEYIKIMWQQLESVRWQDGFKPFETHYGFEAFRSGLSKLAFNEIQADRYFAILIEKLISINH